MLNVSVLSDNCYPTEEIYFKRPALPHLAKRQNIKFHWINCRKTAPESFVKSTSDVVIIFRTLPPSWAIALAAYREKFGRVIYMIDDDLAAANATAVLPSKYRTRIGDFAKNYMQNLLNESDELVVCSQYLANKYSQYDPKILLPTLLYPRPKIPLRKSPVQTLFYHGTRSHKQDLSFIEDAILNAIVGQKVRFESFLGDLTPSALKQLDNCVVRNQKSWGAFKLFQRKAIRQIGLAPLLDTPYNRGKSHIKYLDISAVGAVGIYSNRPPYQEIVKHETDGFLADDDPDQWKHYIEYLIKNPLAANKMAGRALEKARAIGHPKHAYRFWLKLLNPK